MTGNITPDQKDQWSTRLHAALESIQDAIKHLDREDEDEMHGYVMDASKHLREFQWELDRLGWEGDTESQKRYAETWFRESSVMNAFIDHIPQSTLLEEGVYKWRHRERDLLRPALKMPEDYNIIKHGPQACITVACNSAFVILSIGIAQSGKQT